MFTGGRGTSTLSQVFAEHSQIQLNLIINAYDDGLSTGILRKFIPGLLGPSDFRKNLTHLIPTNDESNKALKYLLEYRFPNNLKYEEYKNILISIFQYEDNIYLRRHNIKDLFLHSKLLSIEKAQFIKDIIIKFLNYCEGQEINNNYFDFRGCSFGNIIISGVYLSLGADFNKTIKKIAEVFKPKCNLVNVTDGRNHVLVGLKSDGNYLGNESMIVSPQNSNKIEDIFILNNYLSLSERKELNSFESIENKKRYLTQKSVEPNISNEARKCLKAADIIIYGPGTQHSSLFPSYMTRSVAETISRNINAEKIFIMNIQKDHEIQNESINSICDKMIYYLCRKKNNKFTHDQLVTKYFIQDPLIQNIEQSNYLKIDRNFNEYIRGKVQYADWEEKSGKHSGKRVYEEIVAIANERAKIKIGHYSYLVSIIVPVLNEEKTLDVVLSNLNLLNFEPHQLAKEIIVVDGGSNDKSLDIIQKYSNVRLFKVNDNGYGRGAALRLGISKSYGSIVVFFPADNEYDTANIIDLVKYVKNGEFEVVFGSRMVKCKNLSNQIMNIYNGNKLLYIISKYGGLSLSILNFLYFNRFVSDPLTGLKVFSKNLLSNLHLTSNGIDLDIEIMAKISKNNNYILEIPINYQPRTRRDGKKTTLKDGIMALCRIFILKYTKQK